MTNVEVTFPDSLFAALRKAPHEVGREVRLAASIHWYQLSGDEGVGSSLLAQVSEQPWNQSVAQNAHPTSCLPVVESPQRLFLAMPGPCTFRREFAQHGRGRDRRAGCLA